MSENEETATALDRIRGWREEYRLGLAPSPLEDVTQLSAQLDLTHAHPSGIAQLFAKGHVTLDSLFRDNGMLRAAGRTIDDRNSHKSSGRSCKHFEKCVQKSALLLL